MDAFAAQGMGLVDVVCDEEGSSDVLEKAAWKFLSPFLRHTSESLRAIKTGVAAAEDLPWDRAMEVETLAFRSTWGSPANKHALATAKDKIAAAKGKGN